MRDMWDALVSRCFGRGAPPRLARDALTTRAPRLARDALTMKRCVRRAYQGLVLKRGLALARALFAHAFACVPF